MEHLDKVKRDRSQQAIEMAFCSRFIVHWINHWCWTYDPRSNPSSIPFNLFPKQEELIDWLQEREQAQEDGLVDKSRDMGVTWLCAAYAVHGWLFRDGYAVGFGSRKLDLVDKKGDPDCIFEKIRFLIDNLPDWMRPRGYSDDKNAGYCKVVNPVNGSTITGEGGDEIGRGGRKTIYFVDEAAFLERPQLVERSLSQTTRCRIDVSTPNGPGNPFAVKRFSGKVKVFTLHWRDDPRKGEAWYADMKERKDPVTVAQEIDIDYTASIEGIMIPAAWVRAAVEFPIQASGRAYGGLDIAEYGRDLNVFTPRRGPVVSWPIEWGQCNTTETAYRARDEAIKAATAILNYDCIGVGAGVRGTFESTESPLPFTAHAVNTGESPSETVWSDGVTSKERFMNLRAELWWKVRVRFEKVYEHVTKGVKHPPEEMISIPNHPQLIAELSQPLAKKTDTGKIKLESKDDMRKRGVKSPNYADSLVLSFVDAAVEPWEVPHDPDAQSTILSAPKGVFLDSDAMRGQHTSEDYRDDDDDGRGGDEIRWPWQ